jgi:hypothetical protein
LGTPDFADDISRTEAGHEIDEEHSAAFIFDELVSQHFFAPVVAPFD